MLLVIRDRATLPGAQGVLEQGIDVDGPVHPVNGLIGADPRTPIADPFRRWQILGVIPVLEAKSPGQALYARAHEFGADDKDLMVTPLGDPLGGDIDGILGAVSPRPGVDAPSG